MNRSAVIFDLRNPIFRLHRGSRRFLPWIVRRTFPWSLLVLALNPVIFMLIYKFNPVFYQWSWALFLGLAIGCSWLALYAAVTVHATMTYALKHGRFEEILMTPLETGRIVVGFLMVPVISSLSLLVLAIAVHFILLIVGSIVISPESIVRDLLKIFALSPIYMTVILVFVPFSVILPNLLLGFFLALKLRGRMWSLAAVVIAVLVVEICCLALGALGYIGGKALMIWYLWGTNQRMVKYYDAGEE